MAPGRSMGRTFLQDLLLYAASTAFSCLVLFAAVLLQGVIVGDVVNPDHIDVEFVSVAGFDRIKEALYELVILPLIRPELFAYGKLLGPQNGVLLYGPPGTGKTMLAKAIAKASGAVFINVRVSNLMMAAVFSLAYKLQLAIIFIDEVDSFLGQRRARDHELNEKYDLYFASVSTYRCFWCVVTGTRTIVKVLATPVKKLFSKWLSDQIYNGAHQILMFVNTTNIESEPKSLRNH
ncbi:protein MSP1-like [Hibiscus syriacus]|uniref:protein MSP1-like n=1 Tax=Hibiscus syriacus TaxID=106335 RepID=UPI001924E773|nr:protein MSP1-like [Hibiscus syriacus]